MIFVVKVMTFGLSNWGDNQPHHGTYRVKAVTHKQDKGSHRESDPPMEIWKCELTFMFVYLHL